MEDPTREAGIEREDPADEIRRMREEFRDDFARDPATAAERSQLIIFGLGFNMTVI